MEIINGITIPKDYTSSLNVKNTEAAIKDIKDFFEVNLAKALHLSRVSAPLMVKRISGLNDDLNGVERPVNFDLGSTGDMVEIVHSLAKWKRMALKKYGFDMSEGLYTDMNAIRRDEDLDNLHSIYVDQWDWERIIAKGDRNEEFLKRIVRQIYDVILATEEFVSEKYFCLKKWLPKEITFITSEELLEKYPNASSKERETAISKEYGAVFLMKIGGILTNGQRHDGRAPDYDDWELNGDILLYNPLLEGVFEISSMGIRVDEEALERQLNIAKAEKRKEYDFHKSLLQGELPYTIGGGIGQSRLCMFFLNKAHIGEVQASIWPDDMITLCKEKNIFLL